MKRFFRVLYWGCFAFFLSWFLYLLLFPTPEIDLLNERIAEYEYVGDFSEGLAVVQKEGKIGFVDKSGELVIPLKWDWDGSGWLSSVMFANGRCHIPRTKNEKGHLIDKEGNELSPEMGDSRGSSVIEVNWCYNGAEEEKEYVFTLENLCDGNRVSEEDLKEKYGYEFVLSMNCTNDGVGLITLLNTKTKKYGIVDQKGNIVVPFQYDNNICLCYGLLVEVFSVSKFSDVGLQKYPIHCSVHKDGRLLHEKIAYIEGNLATMGIFLFRYYGDDWCEMMENELDCEIPASAKVTKLLDMEGKEVARIPFGKNFLRLVEERFWLLEDKDGKLVFPKRFQIYSRYLNIIEVEPEDGEGSLCLADDGEKASSGYGGYLRAGIVDMADDFPHDGYPLCGYKKNLSEEDNRLNCHYTKIGDWDNPVNVRQPNGSKLLPYDVDEVSYFSDGLLRLRVGKRYFFVDKEGEGIEKR